MERLKKDTKKMGSASLEAQEQLVEILNDSPRIAKLVGTEWEIRSLRFGTQYLIAEEVLKINKADSANFGDIVKQFSVSIPSVVKVIVLCLLNDKTRIYKDGNERNGFSDEYHSLCDTIMWECKVEEFTNLLLDCLQLLDVTAFMQALGIVQIFRAQVTAKKSQMDTRE